METLEQEHNRITWKKRHENELLNRKWFDWEEMHDWDDYIQQNWNFADEVKNDY